MDSRSDTPRKRKRSSCLGSTSSNLRTQHSCEKAVIRQEQQGYAAQATARDQVQPGLDLDRESNLEKRWHDESTTSPVSCANLRDDNVQAWTGCDGSYLSVADGSINDVAINPQPETIGSLLRDAMVKAAGPGKAQFLPITALNSIITRESILLELQRQDIPDTHSLANTDLQVVVDHIMGTKLSTKSCKKIFAILCLMELSPEICAFMRDGVSDQHLPFESNPEPESLVNLNKRSAGVYYRDLKRSCWIPVSIFDNWKMHNIESFTSYQGWFLAPCFEFSSETRPKFPELHLHDCVVLPFMEEQRKDSALGNQLELPSGCSIVRKVKIHPGHYTISGRHTNDDHYFAVKQLRKLESAKTVSQQRQNPEMQAYKRLDHVLPKHTVRLLATYTHHDQLHLVFPWADGDLHDFWFKHFPGTVQPKRTPQLARWLSQQFLGLAIALQGIHNSDVDESSLHSLSPRVRQQCHGRHGDIKPENILWFKGDAAIEGSYGTLKICDLGSADFHGPESKSVRASAIHEFTGTYRAPEFDAIRRVSPQYDIWSFGCVLLQFMVWYLHGWQGVEKFTERRSKEGESNRIIVLDNFFNIIINKGETWAVQAKQSVRDEFDLLRQHPDCTDFVLDLLQLIQSGMLRMDPAKRAGCDAIVRQLKAIARCCDQEDGYCTQRSIRPISKTSSDLSEIVSVTYSDNMKAEIASVTACNPQAFDPQASDPQAFILQVYAPSLTDIAESQAQDASADILTIHTTTSVDERTAVQTPDDRSVSGLATQLSKDHTEEREPDTSAKEPTKRKIRTWPQALFNVCLGCFRR